MNVSCKFSNLIASGKLLGKFLYDHAFMIEFL